MKTAILGAGAVGCFYGGMLARAGRDVVLIGRAAHVDAIRCTGLRMQTQTFDEQVPVSASTDAAAVAGAKLVLCCVKSNDTLQAAKDMAPYLDPEAIVLSLQNGYDNAERLQQFLGRPVYPAVVYVATEMAGPGHLRHHGRGELVIGQFAESSEVVAEFARAGVRVSISDDVAGQLWAKLVINCAYNGLSAITQMPYGQLVVGDGVREVIDDLVDECLEVAKADGVSVQDDIRSVVAGIAQSMSTQISSTAHDVARGRRSEIDYINGYVVRRAAQLGIRTPVNRAILALVKLLEQASAESRSIS
ncbi:ketopantoate reductase family protein [Azonexus sp. IMCC34839]|uniref:ketopantoate reductase family protein n=1 Tax=Azonexus sp. IMCC34839 TaxID=3133695 RepID=UPI003999F03E